MAAGIEKRICSADSTDRISELPQPLLHHILCFLSQSQALQTCVLSKSWRYLGSTRPKLEILHQDFSPEKTNFRSILEKTLHRYHDQKLCFQEFHVEFSSAGHETVEFLQKLFPLIVTLIGGVKTFHLSFLWPGPVYLALPSELFENSKSLRNLILGGFSFSPNLPMDKAQNLKHLQTLSLSLVHIADETFRRIMSSCRHIEHLVLDRCEGLTTIRLMNNSRLKCFKLYCCSYEYRFNLKENVCLVDVPSLEIMRIASCDNWFSFDRNMYFPALKHLHLKDLRIPKLPSLDILSRDFPCLQHFYIHQCSGFGQLRVSSHSMKELTISYLDNSTKVIAVDAPNLVLLAFSGSIPLDISFGTISNECASTIEALLFNVSSEIGFQRLSKLLEEVRQSKIYLQITYSEYYRDEYDEDDEDNCNNDCQPDDNKPAMPVEYLYLDYVARGYSQSDDEYEDDDGNNEAVPVEYMDLDFYGYLLNRMFRLCRPRNVLERECRHRSEFLCEMLVLRQSDGSPYYDWQRDLEEASMQVWDENSKEWHSVEGTAFLESGADRSPSCHDCSNDDSKHHEVWFTLKWRGSQS